MTESFVGRRTCVAAGACVGLLAILAIGGCSGDSPQTAPAAAASTAENPNPTLLAPLTPAQVGALVYSVTVSPAITPNFDPAILDYVVNCNDSPQVQFTAWLKGQNYVSFAGPGDAEEAPGYPVGQLQESLVLKPGQRFRFSVGASPEYSVRCLPADFPPLTVSVTGTPQAQAYLFAPTLFFTPPANPKLGYVIIVDANGTPIWWKGEPSGEALDAKILGTDQITWTTQNNGPVNQYFVRNFAGQVVNVIGTDLNDHDLQPTPTGTFLAIRDVQRICPPDCADMSPWGGSAQTAALDQEIVELDQNSNILWTWRTRDHIALVESGLGGFFPAAGADIIHMNSVQPDGTDAVLFTARHLSAIYRIIKSTGAIDWKIGAVPTANSLVILGDTRPTAIGPNGIPLSGNHDGRLWPDGTISTHDNGTNAGRPPAIVRYQVDSAARTATVVEEITDALDSFSLCCGSARRVPNGHWVAQWGAQTYMTELDSTGAPVLTVKYNVGAGFSYRAVPILPGQISIDALRIGMDAMAPN